jgi:ElaB/YqjD/DUF883 family membrane-anchored ribosome-binding protein
MMSTDLIARQGTVEGSSQQLVKDLKVVAGDAGGLLKEVAHSASEELSAARSKIEAKLGAAGSGLNEARLAATQQARCAAGATNEYVRDNPWKSMGIAMAVGLFAAFLFGRR